MGRPQIDRTKAINGPPFPSAAEPWNRQNANALPRFAEEWIKLADEAELSAWRGPPAARREPSGRWGSQ
jgi:hypothetical protein